MEFLAQYPLVRYVVEVMFIISLTAVVTAIAGSSWTLVSRWMSLPQRHARWKRPEEFGLACWKLPK